MAYVKLVLATELFYPYLYGGGERRLWEVARRLAKEVDVTVVTSGLGLQPREEVIQGVKVKRISKLTVKKLPERSLSGSFEFFFKTAPAILSEKPDVIDVNTYSPVLPSFIASVVAGKPIVATIHDVYEKWTTVFQSKTQAILGKITELYTTRLPYTAIVTPSSGVREKLIKHGAHPSRIHVIPNGIDLKLIDSVKADKKEGQIACVGRLVPHKRLQDLILALSKLKHLNLTLAVAGEGIMLKPWRKLAEKLEVKARWLGYIPYKQVIKLMKESELLVHPSIHEGQGIAILEAMACRTPVIAAESTGARELLKEAGYIVPKRSPKALAQAILELHENP
ncbi:MAG: hypothetical protein DRN99_09315, partial [Thermoproteota archaeon]